MTLEANHDTFLLMRIVAGKFKGRRLAAVRGRDVRPTSDKVREALFSILGEIQGFDVLDLFAGTGAMGLEALSRGAAAATFVEIDRHAIEVVRRNIDATISSGQERVEVIKGDAPRVVRSLALADERFDLIFFDPPYDRTADMVASTVDSLPTICRDGALVVLEVATRHSGIIEQAAIGWDAKVKMQRTYGDTVVAILVLSAEDAPDPAAGVSSEDNED